MAAAASARRKNGGGKMGGGFDDEFTKMLGGDIGGGDFGSPPSPEPIGGEKVNHLESEDTFDISGYTPTVRGSKKFESAEVTMTSNAEDSAKGGVSASFFQGSDKDDLNSTSLSTLLGSTTERRGGARGSRRTTGAESDPFGFGATTTTSSSTFDSLFGGSSSRRSGFDDPFAKSTREPQEESNLRQPEPVVETKPEPVRDEAPFAPVTQRLSAKDDLLADLFTSEPRSSRSDRHQQEPTAKSEEVDSYEKITRADPPPEPTQSPPVVDVAKQQNDLLAELFATPSSYNPKKKEEESKPKAEIVKETTVTPPRQKSPPPQPVESVLPSGNTNDDLASARDSLLMDLLGDLSSPKPREPLLSRRRSRNNSNNSSPEKEIVKVEDPFKSSLPPSPVQTQSLPTVIEVSTTSNERPVTPPSPGASKEDRAELLGVEMWSLREELTETSRVR